MTRLHYVKKARANIYENGKQVKKVHANGKNKGSEYTKYDRSQPENKKDKIYIKKGEPYYWYQFAFRSKIICKSRPRRSQYATQSEHLGAIYDLEDQLEAMTIDDIEDGCLDDICSEIENIIDTCQERLDNMPYQLQEAPSGQTLQEYIDNCESWKSDLENIDLNINIDVDEDSEDYESELEDKKQSILDEIQGCTYPG